MKGYIQNIARFADFRNDDTLEGIDEALLTKILNKEPVSASSQEGGGSGGGGAAGVAADSGSQQNNSSSQEGGAAASAASAAENTGGAAAATAGETFDLSKWLTEKQGGRYKGIEEVERDLSLVPTLQKQLNEAQSKIPNYSEKVQKAIDFASQYVGMEDEAAARYLQIQRLKVDQLSDQQLRFEAFKLDPKYAGLAEDKQRILFQGLENSQYGDPSNTEQPQTDYQKTLQELATDEAKRRIAGLQQEYQSAKGVQISPEEEAKAQADLRSTVQQELASFSGIPFKFSVLNAKGEKMEGAMNFTIKPEQQQILIDAVSDPLGQWDKILEAGGVFTPNSDQPNRVEFAKIFSRLIFREEIDNQIYKQGQDDLMAHLLKTHRNPKENLGAAGGSGAGAPNPNEQMSQDDKVALAFAKQQGLVP